MVKSILTILFSLSLITPVGAQVVSSTPRDDMNAERQRIQQENEALRDQLRAANRTSREDLGNSIKEIRTERKDEMRAVRATSTTSTMTRAEYYREVEDNFRQKRIQIMETFENAVKARVASTTEVIKANREKLREEVKNMRDEKKKEVVVRVNDSLNNLNQVQTNRFGEYLNKLDEILTRIGTRTLKAEQAGKNVDAVKTASADATNAIAAARLAVATQAGKVYTFSVPLAVSSSTASSTATSSVMYLKDNVFQARQKLHDDLVALRDKVFAARDAVHKAAVELGKIEGIDDLGNGTSTATSTATSTPTSTATSSATSSTSTNQ